MKTALYRYFDANDQLLYIGITFSFVQRMAKHNKRSGWYGQIARASVTWFANRKEALEAERAAIRAECPIFNVVHNRQPTKPARCPLRAVIALPPVIKPNPVGIFLNPEGDPFRRNFSFEAVDGWYADTDHADVEADLQKAFPNDVVKLYEVARFNAGRVDRRFDLRPWFEKTGVRTRAMPWGTGFDS